MSSLLAKSPRKGAKPKTLLAHTQDVLEAARALFGTETEPTRLGRRWLAFFRVQDERAFYHTLTAAVVLHDLGKANEDFQKAVQGSQDGQLLRHEHFSGVLMNYGPMRKWLEQKGDLDWELVLSAVLGHHLKFDPMCWKYFKSDQNHVVFCSNHPDLQPFLSFIGNEIGLCGLPKELPQLWNILESSSEGQMILPDEMIKLENRLVKYRRLLKKDLEQSRLLWAVRAALIVADAAGSGLPREGKKVTDWIIQTFAETDGLCTKVSVNQKIIEPRIAQLESRLKAKNIEFAWSEFQDQTAELPSRALLLAPCGSGKTLAAWRWIAQQANEGVRHCLFLYPTRATATEGFRDYVSWAPETEAAMLHGSAEYELEGLFENPEDTRHPNRYETEKRLFALGYWSKHYFSATVDQFLAFLQYSYSSVCLLPVLADAVVVVDEVHSFDESMFQGLTDFLKKFDVPVLCMTATLPEARQRRLKELGLDIFDVYQENFPDMKAVRDAPRYKIKQVLREDVDQLVKQKLAERKKVLWVVNTVARAQQVAREFAEDGLATAGLRTSDGVPLYCYHSRYRLCDRKERHQEVITAFQSNEQHAVLAVTTQVCEMGLDLDADVLITEVAPTTSLIQRMGRCNRAGQPRESAGEVYVYTPDSEKPYEEKDLTGVSHFLEEIATGEFVRQSDLETALRNCPQPTEKMKQECQFLGSGPFAASGVEVFRDIEAFTLPSILDSDLAYVQRLCDSKQPIDGYVVPVAQRLRIPAPSRLPNYLAVAPSTHYLPHLGFCDEPISGGTDPPCPKQAPLIV
ncbi:ATP-dependent RNA helicase [Planctomycetales bacterium 10988]|nr:ATP-dependent RNA helicase [Planctomycetales bacterium 10988]